MGARKNTNEGIGIPVGCALLPEAVASLRRSFVSRGVPGSAEAEALCRLHAAAPERCPEWSSFYVETVGDSLLAMAGSEGVITEDQAAWLIDKLSAPDAAGRVDDINLVVRVMEKARRVPARLSAFALSLVAASVMAGRDTTDQATVGKGEVETVRRILCAGGHDGAVGITREEVAVLFDINDRTRENGNDPAWSELFIKALVNFLMSARGYAVLTREETLRAGDGGNAAPFGERFAASLAASLGGVWASWLRGIEATCPDNAARNNRDEEAAASGEVRWFADRIGRDGVIHDNEHALLQFLSRESPDIHPSLRTLLDTAA